MARANAPLDLHLFSLRIGNISASVTNEDLLTDFSVFGSVGDFYRPTNMDSLKPCPFAFIRYRNKESADAAIAHYNGKLYGDTKLTIHDSKQPSYFTQDTGYITNEALDTPIVKPPPFDSSLPRNHHQVLLERQLATADELFIIRIEDVPLYIKVEELKQLCREFGTLSSLYYPINLKTNKPRGFGVARYIRKEDAERAIAGLNSICLDVDTGRNLYAAWHRQKEYLSQNENPKVVDGLAYNKYADVLPGFR